MTYASALQRMSEIQTRMGELTGGTGQSAVGTWRNFDAVMQTAQNHFNSGPTRISTPANYNGTFLKTAAGGSTPIPVLPMLSVKSGRSLALQGKAMSVDAKARLTPELEATMQKAAAKFGVPVALVKAVAQAESGFRADAVSGAGAQGMMQLMPSTGRGLGVTDPFDAKQSIEGGTRFLANALKIFGGDLKRTVASYNAGVNAVKRAGGIPPIPETQTYVQRVLTYAREYGLDTGGAAAA